jgi:hypothetical protein
MKTQTKVPDRFVKWKTAALAAAAVAILASTPALAGNRIVIATKEIRMAKELREPQQ